jgi:hypothetical protein
MAIHKRKRYKKGERVDMRGGGRVRLQRGSRKAKKVLEQQLILQNWINLLGH